MSQPTGREGLELLVGTLTLAVLGTAAYFLGHAVIPDTPWFLAVILGAIMVAGGLACCACFLGAAFAVGGKVLDAVNPKPRPWDGTGAPDDL